LGDDVDVRGLRSEIEQDVHAGGGPVTTEGTARTIGLFLGAGQYFYLAGDAPGSPKDQVFSMSMPRSHLEAEHLLTPGQVASLFQVNTRTVNR
jgi:hypothetical protein